jgi:hypothetical protein
MGNHGIKISTVGNDALTQPDNRSVYTSKFSTPKIYKKGYVTITTNGSGIGSAKIVHGFGYAPSFYVYRKSSASFSYLDASTYPGAFHPCPGTHSPWLSYHNTSDSYTDKQYLNIYIEGANNTTYSFVYFIFIDQAEANQVRGLDTAENYGLKVTQPLVNSDTAKEQQTQLSSSYGELKFFKELVVTYPSLTLPALTGDYADTSPQEGTYVDFFHRLGYAPFFLAYAEGVGTGERILLPDIYAAGSLFGTSDYALTAWCDNSRVRVSFWRKAYYDQSNPASLSTGFTASTINLKVYIFAEDLNLQV